MGAKDVCQVMRCVDAGKMQVCRTAYVRAFGMWIIVTSRCNSAGRSARCFARSRKSSGVGSNQHCCAITALWYELEGLMMCCCVVKKVVRVLHGVLLLVVDHTTRVGIFVVVLWWFCGYGSQLCQSFMLGYAGSLAVDAEDVSICPCSCAAHTNANSMLDIAHVSTCILAACCVHCPCCAAGPTTARTEADHVARPCITGQSISTTGQPICTTGQPPSQYQQSRHLPYGGTRARHVFKLHHKKPRVTSHPHLHSPLNLDTCTHSLQVKFQLKQLKTPR